MSKTARRDAQLLLSAGGMKCQSSSSAEFFGSKGSIFFDLDLVSVGYIWCLRGRAGGRVFSRAAIWEKNLWQNADGVS